MHKYRYRIINAVDTPPNNHDSSGFIYANNDQSAYDQIATLYYEQHPDFADHYGDFSGAFAVTLQSLTTGNFVCFGGEPQHV